MDDLENYDLNWYYIDKNDKQPKGPISVRDIDVFVRTNEMDSNTYLWKEDMNEWKKLFQIEELRKLVNTTQTEINESFIRTQIQEAYNEKKENSAVQNYYFGSDGLWHVYNYVNKIWTTQEKVNNLL